MTTARVARTPSHLANTYTHKAWQWMMGRCFTKSQTAYPKYGGCGITVCERWLVYENFLNDMGHRPKGMTLGRSDNDKNYQPGNCQWETITEQNRNKRTNLKIDFQGKTQTAAEWERELGHPYGLVWRRIVRLGWDKERALLVPSRRPSCRVA